MMRTIVVPTDCSELSRSALRYANAIAGRTGAAVVAVYGAAVSGRPDGEGVAGGLACSDDVESMVLPLRQCLYDALESSLDASTNRDIVICDRSPGAAVVAIANERDADLIVMGASERSRFVRALLGSVTDAVLHLSNRPVLILRERSGPGVHRILCPFRDTPQSAAAVREALGLAGAFGAETVFVHVTESDDAAPLPAAIQPQLDGASNFLLRAMKLEMANAGPQLVALADELQADLIVLGTRHRRFSDPTVVGTPSSHIVRMAHCPVLAVTA
jgi:nucleotide-binding universal stress UspA family protein